MFNHEKVRIGFTGTSRGMTVDQKGSFTKFIENIADQLEFHHGDCVGADEEAHDIIKQLGYPDPIIHPPIKEDKRAFCTSETIMPAKEYLKRNRDIVDACDVLIATPHEHIEKVRSGTWSTVRYARKRRKKTIIITPDGEIDGEM